MRIKLFACFFLFAGVFFKAGEVKAQGGADSLLYRQAKLEIWCETMRFIYRDNGADSLLQSLNCQDWVAFDKSMSPNYLQTRTFYQSIEKPSIYSGYTTYNAKLQKLVEEIGKKLRSSPVRAANQNRVQKVDSLQASLLVLAASPTSVVPVQADSEAAPEEVAESRELKNIIVAAPQEAAEEPNSPEDDQMEWNEILQWLMLLLLAGGLAGLWAQNRKLKNEIEVRMNRRKQEISAISRIKESDKPENKKPKPVNEPKGVTQAEVARLVRAEIEKVRREQKARRQEAAMEQQAARRPQEPQTAPAEELMAENRPAAAGREEARHEGEKPGDGIFYDKLPFKGGFHQNHLSPQRHPDSIYSIQVLPARPDEAEFWVTEDQEVQQYAMQNGLSFFEEACDYDQVEENPSRVRTLERGRLRKNGHLWQIEKKVKVSFE